MNFADWTRHHRRSLLFLVVLIAVGGVFGGLNLPVALFPQVDFPRVEVSLDAGDRPADRMVLEATWPMEEAVRSVPGVRDVRSTTSRGSADISITFDWGQDMIVAAQQIEAAVNQTMGSLPAGTVSSVRRMDPTIFPVLAYSLTSNVRSLTDLRDLALYQLRPALSTVSGVARVGVQGGETAEFHVIVDPEALNSYGLTVADVSSALAASNVLQAIGRLEDHYKLYLVMSDTSLKNLQQIQNTVLRADTTGVVQVDDVAVVSQATVPQWTRVTADGRDAVIVQVFQQPGANTVQIATELKAQLATLGAQLPQDVIIANWYDQSGLILSSAGSVRDSVLIGAGLAALVLLLFLRNLKVTLIAIATVPAVLASSTLLLYVFGMSFNIMTLGGMAAAVGLIIDDVIVMIEHIVRRMQESRGPDRPNAVAIAREFTRPLSASSLSTTVIFLPLAFLSGVTGAFFKALSVTMASSLVISFFVSWMAVPLVADSLLSAKDAGAESAPPGRVQRIYDAVMQPLLRYPWALILILVPVLYGGYIAYGRLGSGFMPSMDEGGFILDYRAPPGTSLTETDRLLRQLERLLESVPEMDTYSRRTGLQLGGGITEANEGDFFVRLTSLPRRPIEQVMEEVRTRAEATIPGLKIEMAQLMEDLIGDLTAVPQPIEIKVYSDNESRLQQLGPQLAQLIGAVQGVVDVNDGITLAGDALEIQVNRVKAALQGVDPNAVTQQVQDQLAGSVTTQIQQQRKMIGVRVWLPEAYRKREADVMAMSIQAMDGHVFPLSRIAKATTLTGQPQITRENLRRMIAVTGRIAGRDMGSTVRDVQAVLNSSGVFTGGATYELGGLYRQQQIAFRGLLQVLIAAVVLVFLLLLFVYESFKIAISILVTTLLALPAVFFGLWITGGELNISSMMGLTMIVGIVTEVAIFYCSEYFELVELSGSRRLIAAAVNRARPIAMTTLAAILALLPLGLGIGQGSAMQQPLAVAIISGLLVQLPLVLIVLPTLMAMLGATPRRQRTA